MEAGAELAGGPRLGPQSIPMDSAGERASFPIGPFAGLFLEVWDIEDAFLTS
jgi:hypothetical protein